MPIKVPTSHEEPLRRFIEAGVEDRRAFVSALKSAQSLVDPDDLVTKISREVGLDEKLVSSWVSMFISMYLAGSELGEEFVSDICSAAKDLLARQRPGASVDWQAFQDDLTQALSCHDSLGVTAKAVDVRREYGATYCSGRIITDVRPVFGSNPSAPPLAATVVHTLRIKYHEAASRHQEFYVALDARDLCELRDLVDRAIKKEASLKTQIGKTDMNYLHLEEE